IRRLARGVAQWREEAQPAEHALAYHDRPAPQRSPLRQLHARRAPNPVPLGGRRHRLAPLRSNQTMPFKFKLSNRLALMKASLAAGAILTLACTSDLTDPQLHRGASTAVAIAADLAPLAATTVVASAYQDANVPQNTLDGNLATRWSANGDGQWIRYDLGSTMTIGSITIAWYRSEERRAANERRACLYGATLSPVFTGRSTGPTSHPERYDFPAVPA